jgi:predicted nucleic acid-binding protein
LQPNSLIISLDTSFLIRLLTNQFTLHDNALVWYDELLERGHVLVVPVDVIGEYVVGGNKDDLPFRDFRLLPYNLEEALLAGKCAKLLFERRRQGEITVSQRKVIPNDVKIFASAQVAGANAMLTADEESKTIHAALRDAGLISFDWWYAGNPLGDYIGELPFPSTDSDEA